MEINLANLYNITQKEIDDDIIFNDIDSKLIKRLENVHAKGYLKYTLSEEIEINLEVKGTMYLEDAITLEEIPHNFFFTINELYDENDENFSKITKNNKNLLDINEILWENIVLEVPISLTKASGLNLKGKGWELNSK